MKTTCHIAMIAAIAGWILPAIAGPAPDAPIAWSNVISTVREHPLESEAQKTALAGLKGRRASLDLVFVRIETDKERRRWHLFKHTDGDLIFHCWVQAAAPIAGDQSGAYTGTIREIRLIETGLREAVFEIRMDAEEFRPGTP